MNKPAGVKVGSCFQNSGCCGVEKSPKVGFEQFTKLAPKNLPLKIHKVPRMLFIASIGSLNPIQVSRRPNPDPLELMKFIEHLMQTTNLHYNYFGKRDFSGMVLQEHVMKYHRRLVMNEVLSQLFHQCSQTWKNNNIIWMVEFFQALPN